MGGGGRVHREETWDTMGGAATMRLVTGEQQHRRTDEQTNRWTASLDKASTFQWQLKNTNFSTA